MNSTNNSQKHGHKTLARRYAMQFLYKCEREKLFYFDLQHFREFCQYYIQDPASQEYCENLVRGVFQYQTSLNAKISEHCQNWSLSRLSSIDRAILKIATYEMSYLDAPPKAIINEAIEVAKEYGESNSGRFVNGVLDNIRKSLLGDQT